MSKYTKRGQRQSRRDLNIKIGDFAAVCEHVRDGSSIEWYAVPGGARGVKVDDDGRSTQVAFTHVGVCPACEPDYAGGSDGLRRLAAIVEVDADMVAAFRPLEG